MSPNGSNGSVATTADRIHCHYPYASLFITLDGLVRPCCFGEPLGDLHDQSIREMWNGSVAQRTRTLLSAGDMVGAGCGSCGFHGRRDIETYPRDPELGQPELVSENIRIQSAEYEAGNPILESHPSHAVIQVTEACNFRCTMCFQDHRAINLENHLLDKILAESKHLDEIQFTGGEPFLSKWVQNFLRNFDYTSGVKLGFTTNASLLHQFKEEIERLPRLHLGISIDGATKATFEKIRVRANWEIVRDNIEWFAEVRRRKRPGWDTARMAYVIMRSNYEEIPTMVRWAKDLEMPVLFCPVWGEFAPGENIYDHPELREGLRPPGEIVTEVEDIVSDMPARERDEILQSVRHSMQRLSSEGTGAPVDELVTEL